jgi:transcriptional regulator with XRE-family HTH domain
MDSAYRRANSVLGLRLRYARKELRKLTQPQLAALAGIKQPSLSEIETGETKEVSGPVLIALAKALRVRPEWLVNGDEPVEPNLAATLTPDEVELLQNYRSASKRWRLSLRLMSRLKADDAQDDLAESVNVLMAKISADPVPDSKLGDRWTRPDRKK